MYDKTVWSQHSQAAAHTIHQHLLALLLLVLGIFADDHHMTFALNNLALFANGFDRRTNFHWVYLLNGMS